MKVKNEIGNRYGNLLVVSRAPIHIQYKHARWICQCDCGKTTTVDGTSLRTGNTKRCGGHRHDILLAKGEGAFNQVYNSCFQNSRKRGIYWELTKQDAKELMGRNCIYCGRLPHMKKEGHGKYSGAFVYNSIDRVDSSKGYSLDNVTTACKICQQAKHSMSINDFVAWILRASEYLRETIQPGSAR